MQITKPQALGLSTRPVEYRKRFGLCVSAALHLPFAQGERGTLWSEQSMWNFLAQEMDLPMIDEGVAKLTPEFLVHGQACPLPDQSDACAVRARVGTLEKSLLVFGDRYWDGERATPPQPFEQMPLDWAHAYGGPDFAANPAGKGRTAEEGVRWLPNVELPGDRLLRPDQSVQPAGFGALDIMHPQRGQYVGTYDADYLKLHAPGFAPDLDWRHFNLAPPDQWFEQPLCGDESFAFDHMHPTQPHIEGRLPGLRARVFAGYQTSPGQEPVLHEVPLKLTTLWFFPHAERVIALFQGMAEVETDDGSDVVSLLGAVERLGEVRPDEHYINVLAMRADPRMGTVHALNDFDLLPDGVDTADPSMEQAQKAFAMDGLQAKAQRQRAEIDVMLAREQALAQGKDPDALGICLPPPEEVPRQGPELVAYLEKQIKAAEQQQWAALEDMVDQLNKALSFAEENKVDLAALVHRGPPRFNAEAKLDELRASFAAHGTKINEAAVYPKLIQQEGLERQNYLQSAHMQAPAHPMPTDKAAALRAEFSRATEVGLNLFAEMDLTGADLSNLDLRGANFAGAWLESANLSQSNLSGANFSHAVLAHADLRNAIGIGTDFSGANLGRTQLAGAVFDEAKLTGTVLAYCDFTQTRLARAHLTRAGLLNTQWGPADWRGAQMPGQLFHKLDLKGLVLAEADLSSANFIECDLSGCDLRGAVLRGTTFITCKLDGAQLTGAQADGVIFVQGCTLTQADLSGANLCNANFGAANMQGALLVGTRLDGANLTEVQLNQSDLHLASAKGALLRKTKLREARLSGCNLHDAILQHADLRGADLRRSNLFGADLSRVRLDGDAVFDEALLKRARTWPRLTPEQQVIIP